MALLYSTLQELEKALLPKAVFLDSLRTALAQRQGFAAGKIGQVERQLLAWFAMCAQNPRSPQVRMMEVWLRRNALQYAGLFPGDSNFYLSYAQFYFDRLREFDVVGLWLKGYGRAELELLNALDIRNTLTPFT